MVSVACFSHKKTQESTSYFPSSQSQPQGLLDWFINFNRKLAQFLTCSRIAKDLLTTGETLKKIIHWNLLYKGLKFKGFIFWEMFLILKNIRKAKDDNRIF